MWIYTLNRQLCLSLEEKNKMGKEIPVGGEKSVMSVVQTKVPFCAFLISRRLGRKSHEGVQLHPCASFLHTGTRVKVCTSTGVLVRESLLSHPSFWCQFQPQISSAPAFPLKCPIYTSWGVTRGLWECCKSWVSPTGSVWSSSALHANGSGSTEHWNRGVISFMGTFP